MTIMTRSLLLIAAGSGAGGVCRFLCQQFVQKYYPASIPLGTLSVNIIGCFIIGVIYGFSIKGNMVSPDFKLLAATGFCGGFTTFSAFAYENIVLLQKGDFFNAALYILLSLIAGFAAVYAGTLFTR